MPSTTAAAVVNVKDNERDTLSLEISARGAAYHPGLTSTMLGVDQKEMDTEGEI